jgi:hypothetical protein
LTWTTVNADKSPYGATFLKSHWRELFATVGISESSELDGVGDEAFSSSLGFFLLPAEFNIANQFRVAAIAADAVVLTAAEFNGTECGKVLRVLWDLDQIVGLRTFWNGDLALLPHARDVCLPCFAHPANKTVGATQEQHVRP